MYGLALCAGIGGLELGVARALCGRYRCVGYVERDAYAAASLVARMGDAALDRAPVFDDLESFPGHLYRGRVDLVTAGFPCQPASVAGSRLGRADERWIWPLIAGIIERVAPSLVFLENVPGLLTVDGGAGFRDVLESLASLGFDAEWSSLRASDVGAPHRRERLFVLAVSDAGREFLRLESGRIGRASGASATELGDDCEAVANADGARLEGRGVRGSGRADKRAARATGGEMADADSGRRESERRGGLLDGERAALGNDADGPRGWPPGPDDTDGWREWIAQGGPQPAVRRNAHGLSNRMDRLRCLGNAVVPAQAELALRVLLERAAIFG